MTATLTAPATVHAGATSTATLSAPSTHVCQVPGAVTYESARSFVQLTAANKSAFANVLTRLALTSPLNRLLVNGHTDDVGSPTANQTLSERRATGARAVLRDDAPAWDALATAEGWGAPEFGEMVVEVGDAPAGDTAAIAAAVAAVRGPAHTAARLALFRRYFARLLGAATVPAITDAAPPTLGCGKSQLLRGSPAAPSRDPAQPPITGQSRVNRRVEFYFTAGAAPLTCAEYPTWTTACSLAPPPPTITAAIAPLDSVPLAGTADLQVTITPSPLPTGSSVTLTITASGTGAAVFDGSGTTTTTLTASGPVRLRGTAASGAVDDVTITATVTGQATALDTEAVTVTDRLTVFLRFEVFNLGTRVFDPLPAGVAVDLLDQDPTSDDLIETATTTAGGRVFFNIPAAQLAATSGEPQPDLFFLVHTNGIAHAGHSALPTTWSTAGWKATDGSPGLRQRFAGTSIGTPGVPVVFRIGVDVHAQFRYKDDRPGATPLIKVAPKGVLVHVHSGPAPAPVQTLRTEHDGRLDTVLFTVRPGDDLFFRVVFEIADTGFPRAKISLSVAGPTPAFWITNQPDADREVRARLDDTSVNTPAVPWDVLATLDDRNVAFFLLSTIREWHTFLATITAGRWTGVADLTVGLLPVPDPARPFSWPVGRVNLLGDLDSCQSTSRPTITVPAHWCRGTIVHELSHQIMWKESEVSTGNILAAFAAGLGVSAPRDDVYLNGHRTDFITGRMTALFEGWAALIEAIFAGPVARPEYSFFTGAGGVREVLLNETRVPLDTPANRGEQAEGAFANALFEVIEKLVIVSSGTGGAHIPESVDGNILAAAPSWLTDPAVQDRFHTMIWQPLQDIRAVAAVGLKHTTVMLAAMRTRNPATWHRILPELQAFNMMMTVPTITGITPSGGPPGGRTPITVTGTDFTTATTLTVGGTAVAATVVDAVTLTALTPPGPLGPAAVVVHTAAGDSAPGTFTYVIAPVISSVTVPPSTGPARGPTDGGTSVRIAGTDFDVAATVTFGGTPPRSTSVVNPTEILATTEKHCPPGAVDVVVRNPDGQTGSLSPGFEYIFVGPPPRSTLLDPQFGPTAGGDPIRVEGTGFRPGVELLIGGVNAAVDIALTTATEIHALTPPGTRGFRDVRVVNPDCQEDVVPLAYEYR